LRRFNVDNIKPDGHGNYEIPIECSFCTEYKKHCRRCPMNIFTTDFYPRMGCCAVFALVTRSTTVDLYTDKIAFEAENKGYAERTLRHIYKVIKESFVKI
jgi:hypothetical protein